MQGNTDGGIETVRTGESHSLHVQVNGTAEKLHCVFNKGLVLGVVYTGGTDRTAVMPGKSSEIVIDDGLVAVASCDGRLQIVGDYCRRSPLRNTAWHSRIP